MRQDMDANAVAAQGLISQGLTGLKREWAVQMKEAMAGVVPRVAYEESQQDAFTRCRLQIQGLFAGQNRIASQRHTALAERVTACEAQNTALLSAVDALASELAKTNQRCADMEHWKGEQQQICR